MKNQHYLHRRDALRLKQLVDQLLHLDGVEVDAAEQLQEIVAAATMLPDHTGRKDCVALHSLVTYEAITGSASHTIRLVLPQDADPNAARISVLTPIGLALIGRKRNSLIGVNLPSGRIEKIRILAIEQPDTTACEVV
ncbi:MAG TPA: GreA/GreB family elongation factor [Oxalicibacterium sp.]|uniref:GreA/GreB family elongation factor n=1 Tax=Oxalicibacterium sp. TaxID=2766525 RepID=UPI002C235525|nr:GreA/GreB family elongation factor [Oxalicibacterium sp.]HWU97543.1 GreA/GreB family elongation factor [Oxalicibacterium sp.]